MSRVQRPASSVQHPAFSIGLIVALLLGMWPGQIGAAPDKIAAEYDSAGRKTSMTDADLGSWTYAYDKLDQLTRQSDAQGKSTCLGYNALGQMTAKTIYNASACSGGVAASYSYGYDSLGRLGSVNQTKLLELSWR